MKIRIQNEDVDRTPLNNGEDMIFDTADVPILLVLEPGDIPHVKRMIEQSEELDGDRYVNYIAAPEDANPVGLIQLLTGRPDSLDQIEPNDP